MTTDTDYKTTVHHERGDLDKMNRFGRLTPEEASRALRNGEPVWVSLVDAAAAWGTTPEAFVRGKPKSWWKRLRFGF